MMLFNEPGRPLQTTYTPGPATMEGPPAPHPSPVSLEPHPQFSLPPPCAEIPSPQVRLRRKRKADPQDAHNERLSKRMSLLNLEQNGQKLYVPVEQAQIQQPPFAPSPSSLPAVGDEAFLPDVPATIPEEGEEPMQLDNTKHKVYIYNLDDELSSSENESDADDGRLVFLPDIEKHLRANRYPPLQSTPLPMRIPKPILPNKDGELAGMQLVLYSDGPSSISVPEEQDSVRKAILEARARLREKQFVKRSGSGSGSGSGDDSAAAAAAVPAPATAITGIGGGRTYGAKSNTKISFATPVKFGSAAARQHVPDERAGGPSGGSGVSSDVDMNTDDDADAMDID